MYRPTTKDTANTSTVRLRTWSRVGHETFLSSDADSLMNCRKRLTGPFSYGYGSGGRGDRTRTYNLRFWRPLLCQLSYTPAGPVRAATSPRGGAYGGAPEGST